MGDGGGDLTILMDMTVEDDSCTNCVCGTTAVMKVGGFGSCVSLVVVDSSAMLADAADIVLAGLCINASSPDEMTFWAEV